MISPYRNDTHEYAECDGSRDPQIRFGGVGDMIREKLLAVLPSQFTEEVSGDDPKESDEHQYCVQDTDTGEIAKRSEMRNPFFLWRIINMYRNVFNGNASPGCKDKCFQLKLVFGGVITLVHIHSLDGVQAVAGLSILQFDTCFEGKPEVGKLIGKCILSRHIVRGEVTGTYQ